MRRIMLTLLVLALPTACNAHETTAIRHISTNGTAEVKVKPDSATINLAAKANHRTSKQAKIAVDKQVNLLIDKLNAIGIKEKNIIAASISLNPRYEHRPNTGRYFTGFEATRNIALKLESLDLLTEVLDLALEANINTIQNINYSSSNETEHRNSARQLAIADSQNKAQLLAKAYQAELGAISSINYHSNHAIAAAPQMAEMSLRSSNSSANYLPDEIVFRDSIQVTFDLIIAE